MKLCKGLSSVIDMMVIYWFIVERKDTACIIYLLLGEQLTCTYYIQVENAEHQTSGERRRVCSQENVQFNIYLDIIQLIKF